MNISCDALILREVLINDNDKIITALTAQYGKISFLARGVKTLKSKNAVGLQLFCYSSLELVETNGKYLLKTAILKDMFYGLRSDMQRYCLASYFSEIASDLCVEENDETDMMRLMLNCFYVLSNRKEISVSLVKAVFELKALCISGYMPDLYYCSCCGRSKSESEEDELFTTKDKKVSFYMLEGTLVCNECLGDEELSRNSKYIFTLSYPALYAMRYIVQAELSKILSFKLSENYTNELCRVCEKFLSLITEREFVTLEHYKNCLD